MKTIAIEGTLRKDLGSKNAKQLRREGNVPCVIYGGEGNVHFYTLDSNFKDVLFTAEAHLIEISLEGKTYKTVLRDAQYHPVTDQVEHVDFFETTPGKEITILVPINLIGNARGVRNGGRLKVNLRKLRVKATLDQLPGQLDINIEELRIGQAIRVEDVKTDGFQIMHQPQRTILTIQTARAAVEEVEVEEEGAEGEEATAEGTEETAEAPAEA